MKSCANCKHKVNICCGEWNTLGCSKIGVRITEPDRIFGIPPIVIESIVSEELGEYYCTVMNNKKIKPQKCTLDEFIASLGDFWIKESI